MGSPYAGPESLSHVHVLLFVQLGKQIFPLGIHFKCLVPFASGIARGAEGVHLAHEIGIAGHDRVGANPGE